MSSDRNLINQLLTRAGMMIEDVHGAALIDEGELDARIAAVRSAGTACVVLADAAELLSRIP